MRKGPDKPALFIFLYLNGRYKKISHIRQKEHQMYANI